MEMKTVCCGETVTEATPFGDDEVATCPRCKRLRPVYNYDEAMKEIHDEIHIETQHNTR